MLRCDKLLIQQGAFALRADFTVAAGKITALIGPSGAGKSTLLSAVAGFLDPDEGRVLWDETDITTTTPGDRPVSMLFQDNNLFPHLTVAQNVRLGLRPSLRIVKAETARINDVLEEVGLTGMAQRKPGALSGGQQSRAALARVLLADRPLVLLDEPFSALGPALKAEMLDLVRSKLAAVGRTVIMVTHDPADAMRIADAVILVSEGVAAAPVDTSALFDNPPPALAAYLGEDGLKPILRN
ncbi:ATP-binding cassette domain-containing protein [Loktanella agnita]|uniref:thiamine ABC transporter ATP-binding protein n=1 Tax=Loktanella agnita TaxID=287097 RepID=UPI003989E52F